MLTRNASLTPGPTGTSKVNANPPISPTALLLRGTRGWAKSAPRVGVGGVRPSRDTDVMGFKDRRLRHSLKDPVRGQFQVTGSYFAHPNGNSYREMLTGVVTGPGCMATAGEHLDDTAGR